MLIVRSHKLVFSSIMDQGSRGYGARPRWDIYFDGDATYYELWETKLLAYLHLKKLKKTVLAEGNIGEQNAKNEEAFAEIIQFLDNRSLALVMRDAKDNGKKALQILRQHYMGDGKPRVSSLYSVLTSLHKGPDETITDYILKAESAACGLQNAGQEISDELLQAMVMKGLPPQYKTFCVVVSQKERTMNFTEFKAALRSFEENEKAAFAGRHNTKVMYNNGNLHSQFNNMNIRDGNNRNGDHHPIPHNNNSKVNCWKCGEKGHKSNQCNQTGGNNSNGSNNRRGGNNHNNDNRNRNQRRWCNVCKNSTHFEKDCRRKRNIKANIAASGGAPYNDGNDVSDHSFDFTFACKTFVEQSSENAESEEHSFDCSTVEIEIEQENKQDDTSIVIEPSTDPNFDVIEENEIAESVEVSLDQTVIECEENVTDSIPLEIDQSNVIVCMQNDTAASAELEMNQNVEKLENDAAATAKDDPYLVDSGCTAHIVNDDKNFIDVDPKYKPENHVIELADGTRTQSDAKKKGSVLVTLTDENGIEECAILSILPTQFVLSSIGNAG